MDEPDYKALLHAMCAAHDDDAEGYRKMDAMNLHGWPEGVRAWWCSGPRQALWHERKLKRLSRRAEEANKALVDFLADG